MTVQDYLRVLREQWIVIVSVAVLAVIVAGCVAFLRPPEYTANLTMYVSAQTADTADSAYQGSLLSQQRVTSYVELVSSTRVSGEVIRRLDLPQTPEQLAEQITASSTLDSVLIDVEVTDSSPERAAQVANSVGEVFIGLVDELERPTTAAGVPPVAVRVVQPAAEPTAPSSTGLPVILALGLLAGLAVGVGAALVRNALDTSVRSRERLGEVAPAPILGTIAYDPQVPKRPLTLHEDPQSPRSEAFRQLRTNLQFVDIDHRRKVIVVTSSMPGEGKTTTLCNPGRCAKLFRLVMVGFGGWGAGLASIFHNGRTVISIGFDDLVGALSVDGQVALPAQRGLPVLRVLGRWGGGSRSGGW